VESSIQKASSSLKRGVLDNMSITNNPRYEANTDGLKDARDLFDNAIGGVIETDGMPVGQIKALEQRFGSRLIDRGKRNFSLTPEGRVFLGAAREILSVVGDLDARLGEMRETVAGDLRLAAVLSGAGLARLQASRRLQQRCRQLRRWCRRLAAAPLEPLAEAERLELQQTLEQDLPALLLPMESTEAQVALKRWRDPADPLFHPRPPLDGRQLQAELGLKAGPMLGRLLAALTLERAFGRLPQGSASGALTEPEHQRVLIEARRWLASEAASPPEGGRHD
jgi:DNA-binding transcriptional LysR family regulator